jgi:nucleotide-binding universal stress UspA family protein
MQLPNEAPLLSWKNILAPTDFSEPSKQAMATVAGLAEKCAAKITLLHVVQLPAACPVEAGLDVDEVMHAAEESLEEMAREMPPGLVGEKLVRWGASGTVQTIIDAARELSTDLIVVATHGHSRLKQVWLGGTAEKVVRQAPCPVLVMRRKQNPAEPAPGRSN